jgi:hypothetical protein
LADPSSARGAENKKQSPFSETWCQKVPFDAQIMLPQDLSLQSSNSIYPYDTGQIFRDFVLVLYTLHEALHPLAKSAELHVVAKHHLHIEEPKSDDHKILSIYSSIPGPGPPCLPICRALRSSSHKRRFDAMPELDAMQFRRTRKES